MKNYKSHILQLAIMVNTKLYTGGAYGIGEATTLLFAEHNAHIVVITNIQDVKSQKLI